MVTPIDDEMSRRFIEGAFEINRNISNFDEFSDAIDKYFGTPNGKNAKTLMDYDAKIKLFETNYTKNILRGNVNEEEYEKAYQEEYRQPITTVIGAEKVKIIIKPIKMSSYKRDGRVVNSYDRTYTKWKKSYDNFLIVRKKEGKSYKQIAEEFNSKFVESPKTLSAIKTRYSRVKGKKTFGA